MCGADDGAAATMFGALYGSSAIIAGNFAVTFAQELPRLTSGTVGMYYGATDKVVLGKVRMGASLLICG